MKKRSKRLIIGTGFVLGVAALLWVSAPPSLPASESISTFSTQLSSHKVEKVTLNSARSNAIAELKNGQVFTVPFPTTYEGDLLNQLVAAKVQVVQINTLSVRERIWTFIKSWIIVLIVPGLVLLFYAAPSFLAKLQSVRDKKQDRPVEPPKERFADVKGADEAVATIRQLHLYLTNPSSFTDNGEVPPRGGILEGLPGNGKTMLARALAGEAGVPFFDTTGSSFTQAWAGQTTVRIRGFFDALPDGPCVVFLDELDGIGRKRVDDGSGYSQESANILTQLLADITKFFRRNQRAVILAATNDYAGLDAALKRPEGRLGLRITMPNPDQKGRQEILEANAAPLKRKADGIDFLHLSQLLEGRSGADAASIPNRAVLISRRQGDEKITQDHFEDAIQELLLGIPRASMHVNEADKQVAAIHEAGHTALGLLMEEAADPYRTTIIPAGSSGGSTWAVPKGRLISDKELLDAELCYTVAGRVAENILLAPHEVSSGARHDFAVATHIARQMVCTMNFGSIMREVPLETWVDDPEAATIARDVNELIKVAMDRTTTLLTANRKLLEAIRDELLEKRTLNRDDLRQLIDQYPPEKQQAA